MTNKEKYQKFCIEHPDIPIFSQPWWLDTVCPECWNVILIEDNSNIIATFPFQYKKGRFFLHIGMPSLSQKLGPYIIYHDKNNIISYEHKIYKKIIKQLPRADAFSINFNYKYKNWLPFYWQGYKQITYYTYILENISAIDEIRKNYSKGKKQPLKKARQFLELKFDLPKEKFYDYFAYVIGKRNKQNNKVSFSKELFYRLYDAVYSHASGRVLYCSDKDDNIHAINMVVWDNECAYYLLAMRDKRFNTSGGTEFLVDKTIEYVSQFVNKFDFEGSMIEGVEESYRHYGSRQTEYYNISKCNHFALRLYRAIRKI